MVTSTSAGLTTSYLINYAGQRVKKANSTETVYYVYDDAGHMIGEYDAAGTLIQELIWLKRRGQVFHYYIWYFSGIK
jgi:YD repeat-containing protein